MSTGLVRRFMAEVYQRPARGSGRSRTGNERGQNLLRVAEPDQASIRSAEVSRSDAQFQRDTPRWRAVGGGGGDLVVAGLAGEWPLLDDGLARCGAGHVSNCEPRPGVIWPDVEQFGDLAAGDASADLDFAAESASEGGVFGQGSGDDLDSSEPRRTQ